LFVTFISSNIHLLFLYRFSNLDAKIDGLSTEGSTALGPALTICAGMIADLPQSEVVLCTDGAPNVGIGKIEYASSNASGFYTRVIEHDIISCTL